MTFLLKVAGDPCTNVLETCSGALFMAWYNSYEQTQSTHWSTGRGGVHFLWTNGNRFYLSSECERLLPLFSFLAENQGRFFIFTVQSTNAPIRKPMFWWILISAKLRWLLSCHGKIRFLGWGRLMWHWIKSRIKVKFAFNNFFNGYWEPSL